MCASAAQASFSSWPTICSRPSSAAWVTADLPLLFVLVACVVNIIGDLVLVAGFHLDAAGAAIATVAAQAVSVVCAVVMLLKKNLPFSIKKADFRLNCPVQKVSGHRPAAGTAGVFDPALLSGPLRLCQPPGSGGFLRLRRGLQDRQFRHADSQRPDAVHGFLRLPEHRRRQVSDAPGRPCAPASASVCSLACSVFALVLLQGRSALQLLHHGCTCDRQRLCLPQGLCAGDHRSPQSCSA